MPLWRKNSWCLGIIGIFCCFLLSLTSAIRINEVELNPEGTDTGKEWIELFSEQETNISLLSIRNRDNNTINLSGLFQYNFSFSNYLVINLTSQWLDNSNEKILLIFNNSIVDETPLLSDSVNDNRTWQYCSNWSFLNPTRGFESLCQEDENQNLQQTQTKIYLELENKKEINNNNEAEIEVKAFNLKNESYDIKVYIGFDNDSIISETYFDEAGWKSSNYFVNDLFNSSGNKSRILKIRIDEDYKNFEGDAKIKAKIRKSGGSTIADFEDNIKILKAAEENISESNETSANENEESQEISQEGTGNVIKLNNPQNIKSQEIWKSKTQYIKEYTIYGFAVFCVFIIILLVVKNKSLEKISKKLKENDR